MVIAEMGALSVLSFVPLLGKVSEGHSCPFSSDRVMEVSGAHGKLALDARCLFMFLSEVPQGEQASPRVDQDNSSMWEQLAQRDCVGR